MAQFNVSCGGSAVTINGSKDNVTLATLWAKVPEMCKYAPPIYQFQAVKLNYTGTSICLL